MSKARNDLIRRLCKKEGKKVQVSVGNMREVVGVIAKDIAADLFKKGFYVVPLSFKNSRFLKVISPAIHKELRLLEKNEILKSRK